MDDISDHDPHSTQDAPTLGELETRGSFKVSGEFPSPQALALGWSSAILWAWSSHGSSSSAQSGGTGADPGARGGGGDGGDNRGHKWYWLRIRVNSDQSYWSEYRVNTLSLGMGTSWFVRNIQRTKVVWSAVHGDHHAHRWMLFKLVQALATDCTWSRCPDAMHYWLAMGQY